jgi:hypothetical protein
MSALVDIMQDYKKCHEKIRYTITMITAGLPEHPVITGTVLRTDPGSKSQYTGE